MIRFVDLTAAYWIDPKDGWPCCAFLDTTTDKFLPAANSTTHVCSEPADVPSARCRALVPQGFWRSAAKSHG